MNSKLLGAFSAASISLLLMACGDETTTQVTEVTETTGMEVVASGDSMPDCDDDNVGKMLFVTDSAKVYYCADGEWSVLNGADGEDGADGENGLDGTSCTVKILSDSSGYNVVCGGDTVGTILNGDKGDKGDKGADGTSCTAEALEDGSGYNVVCGGDTVGTVLNGVDGKDGASCTLSDDGSGSVTVTCGEGENAVSTTLYKAMCGTTPYDPANGFCYADSVYSCGGAPYDPAKGFCYADSVYELCGKKDYDPAKQYCDAGTVKDLATCGTSLYNPLSHFCDTRDNQIYKYVTIGTQTWMGSNLNYDPGQGGSEENLYDWSWCYDGKPENCTKYGRLYTWAAAIDSMKLATDAGNPLDCGYKKTCELSSMVQGVCPSGWHLPDTTEWRTLINTVGGQDGSATALKSTGGWYNDGNGTDTFGFSALPAGYRDRVGDYDYEGYYAYFLSSTEYGSFDAYIMYLYHGYDNAVLSYMSYVSKNFAFSVRCLKD